jgi:hypothetical protein
MLATIQNTRAPIAAGLAALLAVAGVFFGASTPLAAESPRHSESNELEFDMVVSGGARACLPDARGHVELENAGPQQRLSVEVEGLPPNTTFTLFVLQVPTAPFAMSWYQGDIATDKHGRGREKFFGIFSDETFAFAPAVRTAPQTHPGVDAGSNPATAPVHTYHLGIWFDDPADAGLAGCPATVTPFNGDHHAGIQVLNTSNFGTEAATGPLGQFK